MKTAFVITKYELHASVLEEISTTAELKKRGYERCVILDSSLSSYAKWHLSLSRSGIVAVPGIRTGNDYWIARNERGFEELLRKETNDSENLIHISGKPRNLDSSSGNPIWECRYLDHESEKFRVYASLQPEIEVADYSLPNDKNYRELEHDLLHLLSELPRNFSLKRIEHVFPVRVSAESFSSLLCKALEEKKMGDEYLSRLKRELSVILAKNIQDYFMTVSKIVDIAKSIGCWIGPGRGSAVGSLVSYLLEITRIDPVAEDLFFERFLSLKRADPPDIDLDVDDKSRPVLLKKMYEYFGNDRFCLIRTYSTYGFKGAARELGKKLGISKDNISKLIEWSKDGKRFPYAFEEDLDMKRLFDMSKLIAGLFSGYSLHAAGVILSGISLKGLIPIDFSEDLPVSLWDMDSLRIVGLQKIDILGLRNLSLLKEMTQGKEPWESPACDSNTYETLGSGYTTGIFQLEAPYATKIIRSVKPSSLRDLSICIALNRPGPIKSGVTERFLKLSRVPSEIEKMRKRVPVLAETAGLLVYQEQVLKIASSLLSLEADDGELLRRALSKKDRDAVDRLFKSSPGYSRLPDERRAKLYSFLLDFAGYAFNKSHSLSYAVISFWLAYFKSNHPEIFYPLMLRELPRTSFGRLVAEMRDRGLRLSIENEVEGRKIVSLSIPQLLKKGELKPKPFEDSFFTFVRNNRSKYQARDLERLIKSGYLDCYGSRNDLLKKMNDALTGVNPELKSIRSVFGYKEELQEAREEDTPVERAMMEIETLGFNVTEIQRPDISSEVTDFEITSAVASLRTGISPYKRIDYLGKSFVTDGRTFIQIESHVPLQGFVLFNNGNPIEMKERILEVNRIFHGQIDRSFLAVGSKRENVVVKVRGTEKIIPGARPMGVDADKIIWR
ncbi:DNA polymerase III subunit alpha [Mesotoga prima]|uniref:DNA polymerase III subunit alpha n=1 Tax=Mesotoga prima TaxID=1184387 RepID=UPI002B6AA2BA|nr:DNA polymerase III subunit alpha [Mesotoga prima]HOZ98795.1 DNA polymerase III subunit alpha [Mesotoga prima]HQN60589.1 DNA polymerase III subunit alpha [Mesotoga prima]HUM21797.1 DNA polymerase III subunit alpha [Mesotoga prima]